MMATPDPFVSVLYSYDSISLRSLIVDSFYQGHHNYAEARYIERDDGDEDDDDDDDTQVYYYEECDCDYDCDGGCPCCIVVGYNAIGSCCCNTCSQDGS